MKTYNKTKPNRSQDELKEKFREKVEKFLNSKKTKSKTHALLQAAAWMYANPGSDRISRSFFKKFASCCKRTVTRFNKEINKLGIVEVIHIRKKGTKFLEINKYACEFWDVLLDLYGYIKNVPVLTVYLYKYINNLIYKDLNTNTFPKREESRQENQQNSQIQARNIPAATPVFRPSGPRPEGPRRQPRSMNRYSDYDNDDFEFDGIPARSSISVDFMEKLTNLFALKRVGKLEEI